MSEPRRPAPTTVIVAYRADSHLAECLEALDSPASVVVIDNSPADSTRAIATASRARYLAEPANVGFAAAVNRALDAAWDGASDVLLLNPDARIGFAEVLTLQAALYDGEKVAAVGPELMSGEGERQRATWPMPSPSQVWLDAIGLGRFVRGTRFVVGAVLLLRADAINEIGRFDERYFLYAEEADWQLRAQRAGWSVRVVNGITAVHEGAASSSDAAIREHLFQTSAALFAQRWYGRTGWFVMQIGTLVAALRRCVVGSRESRARSRHILSLYLRRTPSTRRAA